MIPEEQDFKAQYDADAQYDDYQDQEADDAMDQWLDQNPERDADDYTEWYLLTGGR